MYVPFYNSEDASSPSAELDALTFVVWHSICAERNGGIMNPMNEGILSSSKKILELWHKEKDSIPANYMLADLLFGETIFDYPTDVRNVLA